MNRDKKIDIMRWELNEIIFCADPKRMTESLYIATQLLKRLEDLYVIPKDNKDE